MTACIGIAFGSYVLLASDTRTTWCYPDRPRHTDASQKIHRSGIGLVTGAGLVQLLDQVKDALKVNEVLHTDQIKRFVEEACQRVRRQFAYWGDIETWVRRTAWLVSYGTVEEGRYMVRLALLRAPERHKKVEIEILAPMHGICLLPPEVDDHADELCRRLTEDLHPISDFASPQEHFEYHRLLMLKCMAGFAQTLEFVSQAMHLGIHTDSGQCEISERIDLGPFCGG